MPKIYGKGNYIFVEIEGYDHPLVDTKLKTAISPLGTEDNLFKINSDIIGDREYPFSEIEDENGIAYLIDDWNDFWQNNTGFDLDIDSTTSLLNNSITPLNNGITFVGESEINAYTDVMVQVATDQNGTLYCEFSPDGINWDTSLSFEYNTNRINPPHIFVKAERYFRVRFINNSGSNQTYLRLNTYYGSFNKLTSPINGALAENYDATAVRPTDYRLEVASGKRQGRSLWNKFGYNNDIDVGTEVIASWGGTFNPLTTATTLNIVSTSANDTNGGTGVNSLVIYGIDESRNEAIEVVTMNGTTPVVTVSSWLGINRVAMFLCGSSQGNEGTINITSTTGGSQMAQMPLGGGVTQQCIFHIPKNYNFNTEWLWINVINKGKNAELTLKFWVYSEVNNGKQEVFKIDVDTAVTGEPIQINPSLPFPISEKSVCWLECTSNKNDVTVNARFSGILERIK